MARKNPVQHFAFLVQKYCKDSWTAAKMENVRENSSSEIELQPLKRGSSGTGTAGSLENWNPATTLLRRAVRIFVFFTVCTSASVLALRVSFKTSPGAPNLQAETERPSVTILENGEIIEMRARTFDGVREWCLAYQEEWQVYNNLCLNEELSADYRRAALAGKPALADYRKYPVQPVADRPPETMPGTGGRAEIRPVEDMNTRTHAAKYIYGTICTGVLNYACRKILETSTVKPDTDTVNVPTSEEVDALLARFDQQTPQVASADAAAAEQVQEAGGVPEAGEPPTAGEAPPSDQAPPQLLPEEGPGGQGEPQQILGEAPSGQEAPQQTPEGVPEGPGASPEMLAGEAPQGPGASPQIPEEYLGISGAPPQMSQELPGTPEAPEEMPEPNAQIAPAPLTQQEGLGGLAPGAPYGAAPPGNQQAIIGAQ